MGHIGDYAVAVNYRLAKNRDNLRHTYSSAGAPVEHRQNPGKYSLRTMSNVDTRQVNRDSLFLLAQLRVDGQDAV